MKKLTLLALMIVLSLWLPTTLFAQLVISNQGSPAATILNGFIGSGLTISNPVLNCPSNAYGTFSGGAAIGVTTGVAMTTGNAGQLANPESYFMSVDNNTSCNDPQLNSLDATANNDCCILEFDVIPQCNQLTIRFVFGSEEYPNYVNSSFNDAFGFFVSGPNPAGGNYTNKNIAIVTGTTICSIDNVNANTNSAFYVNNSGGTTLPFGGYTTAITSSLAVTPCQSYHFKIAIADASDNIFDSGVFIDFLQCTTIMTASLTATPDNCSAGNGTATVSVQNGLGPLTYTWSPAPGGGQGTTTATGLTAGVNYTCTVDDTYSCIDPATASIVIPGTVGPITTASSNGPVCAGTTLNLFASNTGVAGTTFSWTGPNGFNSTLQNPTIPNATTAASGDYTVTVSANGCSSQSIVSVIVNPVPTMTDPSDVIQCNGMMIPASNFISNPGGATFSWTNNNTGIGLAASGTGNYSSFSATNTTSSPIVSTIVVTPTLGTCAGPSQTFTITVNPTPVVNAISNIAVCSGASIPTSTFGSTPTGATFTWVNSNVSIGLGANGTGNTPAFTASNTSASPAIGTVSVTPSLAGCVGTALDYTITVNPVPVIDAISDITQCVGTVVATSNYSTTPTGATFTWTNDNVNTGIAANGTGNIASFTGTNTTATPQVSTITVTPTIGTCVGLSTDYTITINPGPTTTAGSNSPICEGTDLELTASNTGVAGTIYDWSGPGSFTSSLQNPIITGTTTNDSGTYTVTVTASGCSSTSSVDVTVNAVPVIDAISDITQCAGTVVAASNYTTTPTGATFAWTNDNVNTGIAANGTGNIASFTGTNTTITPQVSTITVTPTIGTCVGLSTDYTITINPGPTTTAGSNSPICEGTDLELTASNTGVVGTIYDWSGPGAYTSNLQNPIITGTTTNDSGTYTVTVTASGCSSTSSVDVTVNPVPVIDAISNITQCVGTVVATSNYTTTPTGATFSWTNDNVNTGIAANGTGNIASFTGTNTTITPQVSTITVTPTIGTCVGVSTDYSITINPGPTTTAGSNSPICEGTDLELTASNTGVVGTIYDWSGPGAYTSNLQNPIITGTTTNDSGTYTVTVTASGCSSTSSVDVTVNAVPVIDPILNITQCVGTVVATSNYTTTPAGATFSWTNDNVNTGIAANGNGNIASFTGTNTTITPQVSTITVTPTIGTCVGLSTDYTITINPGPTTTAGSNSPICEGTDLELTASNTGVAGTIYDWSGPGAYTSNLQNPIITGTTTNDSGTYTVTVTASGCSSTSSVDVTVNAVPVIDPILNITQCVGTVVATSNYTTTPAGATFSWTNDNVNTGIAANGTGNIASFTGTNTTITPQVSTITVTPTIGTCVGLSTDYTITINPGPTTTAGSNSPICEGTDLELTASNTGVIGTIYDWSGPGSFTSSLQNPVITGTTTNDSGSYTVTVTASGCSSTSTVDVTVNPIPTTIAMVNSPVCDGEDLNFQADPFLNSVPGVTYSWSGPELNSTQQLPTITGASVSATGTYVVTVSANGCSSTSSVDAIVNPIPTTNANSNSPVCEGEDLLLTATDSPGATYLWTGPDGFSSSDQNPIINGAIIANEGVYSVLITANGCTSGSSTGVMVNAIPVVVASSNSPICEGEAISLICNNNTGAMFEWTGPNNFASSSQNANIFISTLADAGTYTVTVTKDWCSASASVDVVVNEMPQVDFVADDFEGCSPLVINFTNNSTPTSNSVVWNFGDGTTSSVDGTVSHVFYNVGCYDVSLTSTTSGCTSTLTQDQMVCVLPDAIADFSSNQTSAMLIEPSFEFYNNSSNASIYTWNFGDGETANTTNATHEYEATPGDYIVQLIANNAGGCPDTAYMNVEVKDELIFYVPNTFTPDNDKFNQTFEPIFYSGYDPQTYTLLIFNRWGEVIFESHDVNVGWDGTYGGTLSQDGSYTWKITFNDSITDETYQYLGHVNLIR
jgi:gliding motility-associated-like protein